MRVPHVCSAMLALCWRLSNALPCERVVEKKSEEHVVRQDVEKGGVELDTCNNVLLRGPVNILHDPASALPYTQGVITGVTTDARKKVAWWDVQARCGLLLGVPSP